MKKNNMNNKMDRYKTQIYARLHILNMIEQYEKVIEESDKDSDSLKDLKNQLAIFRDELAEINITIRKTYYDKE